MVVVVVLGADRDEFKMDYSNKTIVILICRGREIVDHTEGGMNNTAGLSVFIFGLWYHLASGQDCRCRCDNCRFVRELKKMLESRRFLCVFAGKDFRAEWRKDWSCETEDFEKTSAFFYLRRRQQFCGVAPTRQTY